MAHNLNKIYNWPSGKIGNLLTRVSDSVKVNPDSEYQEIGIRSHCKGIFHKQPVTGNQLGNKRVFWIKPGCLVFNIVFAWEQAVAFTSEKELGMIASHRFPMYESTDGTLLPEYAFLYYSSPRGKYDLTLASPGGAGRNKTLGQGEFKRLLIAVPPPHYQQLAINVIRTWDEVIETVSRLIESKCALKKGLMQQLLTGKHRIPGFAGIWMTKRIGETGEIVTGSTPSTAEPDYWGGNVPFVTPTDMHNDHSISTTARYITDKALGVARLIPKDSVLFVCIASIGNLTCNTVPCATNQQVNSIVPNSEHDYRFLYYLLAHSAKKIKRYAGQTAVPIISKSEFSTIRLNVPHIEEQRAIADVLSKLDNQIELDYNRLIRLKNLKRGLMQKLLTGQVRVKV